MDIALWIIAGLVALAMLGAGGSKLAQPRDKVIASGMTWAEDFSPGQLKLIGALEVLGGLGLILPAALGVAEILTPIAAAGIALVMTGAVVTHVRRGERKELVGPVVLGLLAAFVAVMRFGPYQF